MKIVIIGGGFAGINLALSLSAGNDCRVILVDRNNYIFFPPLLYQVATGYLDVSSISYPFRKLLRHKKNISVQFGELLKVLPEDKKLVLSTGEMQYDVLVLATGAATNYFGNENVKRNALQLKTVNDAIELRNHFLMVMEQAALTNDKLEREKLLTIVVAGAGPTGVEVSGMLSEMKKYIVPKDYPELAGKNYPSHIYLVDGGPKVLGPMSEQSQKDTFMALTKMGVEIKLGLQVTDYINDTVFFNNGEVITTKTLVWAAGVMATATDGIPSSCYGWGKRLLVDQFNQVSGLADVYAIGDTCLQLSDIRFPNGHPQLAQVAIQQGKALAKNILLQNARQPMQPFQYKDKGTMAIIGRNKAVVDIPKPTLHFRGFIAWTLWLFVHVMSLINYRNRIKTLYNWTGAYWTKDQALRMIIRPAKKE